MDKEQLKQELDELKALGIDFDFDENTTDEEKMEAINALGDSLFDVVAADHLDISDILEDTQNASLELLTALTKDVSSTHANTIVQQLKHKASELQNETNPEHTFANSGLYHLFYELEQNQLALQIDHSDPIEIGELFNAIFKTLQKEQIEDEVLETIEEAMFDDDEPEEYVWTCFYKELQNRQLTLLLMRPIKGMWSDQLLIPIATDKANKWFRTGIGNYALIPYFQ